MLIKKLIVLIIASLNLVFTAPLEAKLNWQSPETWKSYYPYVTFVNKTKYDLELAIVSNNSETEWQPIAKDETLPLVFTPGFKELRAKLPVEGTLHLNPMQEKWLYDFTKNIMPDLEMVYQTLQKNPYASAKLVVVIKENNNPFKIDKACTLKYRLPDLTIVVHTEFVNTQKTAMYKVAKTINSSTR